jgi:hypothetical protein
MMKKNVKRQKKQRKKFRSLQLRTLAYCMGISMTLLAVCLAVMFIYMDRSCGKIPETVWRTVRRPLPMR